MRVITIAFVLYASCLTAFAETPEPRPAECLLQQQSKRMDGEVLKPVGDNIEIHDRHVSHSVDLEADCDGEVCYKDYGVGECRVSNRAAPYNEPQKLSMPLADCKRQCTETEVCLGYSASSASCLLWVEGPLEAGGQDVEAKTRCFIKQRRSSADSLPVSDTSLEKSLVEGEHEDEVGEKAPDDSTKEAQLKAKEMTRSLQSAKRTEGKLDTNIDKMKSQLKDQQETQAVISQEIEKIQKALTVAKDSLSVCESDVSSLHDELTSVKKEIAEYTATTNKLNDAIGSLKEALDAAKAKRKALREEKEKTQKDLSKVRSATETKSDAVRKLQDLVKTAKESATRAEEEARAKIERTRAAAEAEKSKATELKNGVQELQDEIARLTEQKKHLDHFLQDSQEAAGYLKPYNLLATSNVRQHSSALPHAGEGRHNAASTN